jgi:adenylate cyclase
MATERAPAPRLLHRIVAASLTALLVVALYVGWRDGALFRAIESQALALRFEWRGPIAPGDGLAIVAIDDETLAETGGWPLPRHMLAELVERLAANGADIVVLDLLLTDLAAPTDGNVPGPGDQLLIEAARKNGRLVLPIALILGDEVPAGTVPLDSLTEATFPLVERQADDELVALLTPQGALAPYAAIRPAATLGHVNLAIDADGQLRAMYHALGVGDYYFPSLPIRVLALRENVPRDDLAAVIGKGVRLGSRLIPTGPDMALPINFLGPAETVPTYSLRDVMADMPTDAFRDRIVFVGAEALGIGDGYATPYGVLHGVEALATVTDNLLYDRALVRDERTSLVDLVAIVLLALLMAALPRLGRGALFAVVILIAGWEIGVYVAFVQANWWLDATLPAFAGLLSAAFVIALWFADERRGRERAEREKAALAPYVSPVVTAGLAEDVVADRPRPAAIMFVDLAGYTRAAERLDSTEASDLLRRFRQHLTGIVERHGGIIEKFVGDGAMILFGVPEPDLRDPIDALACARDLVSSPPETADSTNGAMRWQLHVGLHYGPVTLARIGDQNRAEITATGDTVNVASRLEAATRELGAEIAASAAIAESVRAAGRGDLLDGFRRLPDTMLRGREEPIDVWLWGEAPVQTPGDGQG